jgi:hypothetical protein
MCVNLKTASFIFPDRTDIDTTNAFSQSLELENLTIKGTLDVELPLLNSPKLSSKSIDSIIYALKDRTGMSYRRIYVHSKVLKNLTE